jgi:membrane-associated phospholipid phosphatase
MNVILLITLFVACGVMMILESRGLRTTLSLSFKGDIKRESRWLAQYGQSVCTPVAGLLIWQLDPRPWKTNPAGAVVGAVVLTSIICTVLKRLLSRVRPGRENAGKFLGPNWKHANYRESFPSSHSACAVALTVMLAVNYPQARATFWALALLCAVLRYLMDAHWPSDVLGGIAIGYGVAYGVAKMTPMIG